MLSNPASKYSPFPKVHLPNRQWPERSLKSPPRWLSTDLRDGNQALPEPMGGEAKLRYFKALLKYGYKEIEVSYPSASTTEYDFTRQLITTPGLVPDDIWLQVMAPCREDLIRKTVESVRGANKVILHIHVSTSACFREIVLNLSETQMVDLVVRCVQLYRQLTVDSGDPEMLKTEWALEFTPENFQDTSVGFALRVCEAAKAVWQPRNSNPIIFNLTSTVEVATPNIFADQVELFCQKISEREKVCVSVHNHNDRGCGVATAEMSQLAGADRVEGCIFGNGERTGNVDLVTLALNLYTQGVHPGIDFGDLGQVVDLVEELTNISIHARAPYAGKLTFCTFTGTHQDAIRKGYRSRRAFEKEACDVVKWRMPYLPMDPNDLGRKHEPIIRINAQSGKGGVAWFVNEVFGMDIPRELEIDFTKVVKTSANASGLELTHEMLEALFRSHYMLHEASPVKMLECEPVTLTHSRSCFVQANGTVQCPAVKHSSAVGTNIVEFVSNEANGIRETEILPSGVNIDELSFFGDQLCNGNGTNNGHGEVSKVQNESIMDAIVQTEVVLIMGGEKRRIIGVGGDVQQSIMNIMAQLGFHHRLLHFGTLKCSDRQTVGNEEVASFVKVGSIEGSMRWGVGFHPSGIHGLVQAIISACVSLGNTGEDTKLEVKP